MNKKEKYSLFNKKNKRPSESYKKNLDFIISTPISFLFPSSKLFNFFKCSTKNTQTYSKLKILLTLI
jgi:hypothetical protein